MNRDWIYKPRTSAEYKSGISQFLEFAFSNVPQNGKVLCPCVNCGNCLMQSYGEVKEHLRCDGFLKGYTIWTCHDESTSNSCSTNTQVFEDNNIPESYSHAVDDMHGLLHAALGVVDEPNTTNLGGDEISDPDI